MIELQFHPGCPDGKRLKSLVSEFVRVIQDEDLVTYDGRVIVEVFPTMFVADSFGMYFPPWPDPRTRYVQVVGIDCLTTPWGRKRCEELELDPGTGPWPFRFMQFVSHELSHALGIQNEDLTWECCDKLLEAARSRSPLLRQGTRRQ